MWNSFNKQAAFKRQNLRMKALKINTFSMQFFCAQIRRYSTSLSKHILSITEAEKESIEVVSIEDRANAYAKAVREPLPHAAHSYNTLPYHKEYQRCYLCCTPR